MANSDGVPFSIHVVGDATGETWIGEFSAKERLSFKDQIQIAKVHRDLLGGSLEGIDPEAFAQAKILAELSVRLVKTPKWWQEAGGGMNLVDTNLIIKVYEETQKVQNDAIARVVKAGEDAKEQLRDFKTADPTPKDK